LYRRGVEKKKKQVQETTLHLIVCNDVQYKMLKICTKIQTHKSLLNAREGKPEEPEVLSFSELLIE